ncbi:H/ACA ribonucleoprotein complex subunit 4-like isoform X1 [Papaver somniferum]|uniref:H/ACA ribonucleoprotein complex subunit 4-like isoform X1 n=1 Tax=Papaver somniferum TaxID=3469 RepID=UPI000E6FE21A|nr:H/ACA ribonucleoprotein complex subunit 4-like isoform X1 [Papaver somniferum]
MDLQDFVDNYRSGDEDVYDDSIVYGDGYDDYEGECFYLSTDDDEGEGTIPNDARILGDEKKKPDMSGTRMEKELSSHHLSGDGEKTNMDIEDKALEENMATERKKKEKRKSQEDGVESEQNSGMEIAIEVKKKKDSISKNDVQKDGIETSVEVKVLHKDEAIKEQIPSIHSTTCAKAAYNS